VVRVPDAPRLKARYGKVNTFVKSVSELLLVGTEMMRSSGGFPLHELKSLFESGVQGVKLRQCRLFQKGHRSLRWWVGELSLRFLSCPSF